MAGIWVDWYLSRALKRREWLMVIICFIPYHLRSLGHPSPVHSLIIVPAGVVSVAVGAPVTRAVYVAIIAGDSPTDAVNVPPAVGVQVLVSGIVTPFPPDVVS